VESVIIRGRPLEGETPELRFEELPDIPKIWIDFTSGFGSLLPFLPARPDIQSLLAHADRSRNQFDRSPLLPQILEGLQELGDPRAQENIQRLRQPQSFVVITNIDVSLFGGAASQLLKCLTTVKMCEELERHGIMAVPVGWIHTTLDRNPCNWSISVLDSHSDFHRLYLQQAEQVCPSDGLPSIQIAELVARIDELGNGTFDPEVIETLKTTNKAETDFFSATARIFSILMNEWGMIVLNLQSPELASIASAFLYLLRDRSPCIDVRMQSRERELAHAGYRGEFIEHALPDHCIPSSILPVIASVLDPEEL